MKTYTQKLIVSAELTAANVGSGLLPVYATPSVVALMENTACELLANLTGEEAIAAEDTTVGVHIDIQHLKASPIGEEVICEATLTAQEGRKYAFSLKVTNAKGDILATATHERVRVNKERFMGKVALRD